MNPSPIANQFLVRIAINSILLIFVSVSSMLAEANEQPIGRLFTSQRERATLDQDRQTGSKSRIDSNTQSPDQIGDQVTLDGFVKKNNGKTTVWINQVPQHWRESPQGITIVQSDRHSTAISMQLPSGKNVNLKAGQKFDATNGKVTDVYDALAKPGSKETGK
jgi:hypothetical protein